MDIDAGDMGWVLVLNVERSSADNESRKGVPGTIGPPG